MKGENSSQTGFQPNFYYRKIIHKLHDRTERYDFRTRLCLFFSPFLFPPNKSGRRKGE